MAENELLQEFQEDLQRERLNKLWHSFGKLMVGISIGIVLATIIVVIRQNHRDAYAAEQTAQFIKGTERMNIEDYKGAIAAFSTLAADTSSPYYGLAMLRKAESQAKDGDKAAVTKTYQELAAHDPVWGGIAKLHLTDAKLTEPDKRSPFYLSDVEWKGWQLLQQGKRDEAMKLFTALANDPKTPFAMRGRMQAVLHYAPGGAHE